MEINLPYRQVFLSLENPPKICFACTKSCLLALSLFLFFFFQGPDKFCDFPSLFFPPKTALCNFLARWQENVARFHFHFVGPASRSDFIFIIIFTFWLFYLVRRRFVCFGILVWFEFSMGWLPEPNSHNVKIGGKSSEAWLFFVLLIFVACQWLRKCCHA